MVYSKDIGVSPNASRPKWARLGGRFSYTHRKLCQNYNIRRISVVNKELSLFLFLAPGFCAHSLVDDESLSPQLDKTPSPSAMPTVINISSPQHDGIQRHAIQDISNTPDKAAAVAAPAKKRGQKPG